MSATLAGRLIILGASGDLTGRFLLPALAELEAGGHLSPGAEVVGVSRDNWDDDEFRRQGHLRLSRHAADIGLGHRDALLGRLRYVSGDATDPAAIMAAAADAGGPVLAYLALPPAVFAPAIAALAAARLPPESRIVVEKPFGTDLDSAVGLNRLLLEHFPERTVFRIDHFLGMQTVQNLLGLRFANRVFEPLWCSEHVAAVDITWDETVALEGRAGYYDHTGALRDMIQNHLLQLLALSAMERPAGLDESSLRDAKLEALRAVRRGHDNVEQTTLRARYEAGEVKDRNVPSYVDEPDVEAERATETFAQVILFVDNQRWRGVPFRLRTGKALGADRSEITLRFRPVQALPFCESPNPHPNTLTMRIDPDHLALGVALNGSGDPFILEPAQLDIDLAPQELSAYARLLLDALAGNPALSIRGDEAEESWRIVEPILSAWRHGEPPLRTYRAGSLGPDST